jgi:stage V sporulation protein B
MDKAVKMGKTSVTGSFQLFIGKSISSVILAISSIIVGIYILQGEYGLYTIALVPSVTLLLFQDWGVGTALTRNCAKYRAAKKEGELRNIIVTGLAFEATTGIALTLFSLLTASFIASTIYGNDQSAFLIALASITILSSAIYVGCDSVFVGFERMKFSTIALIVFAIIQGFLSSMLVYLGFGAFGAVVGYTLGSLASMVTAVMLLYFAIFRKLPSKNPDKVKFLHTLKPLLQYGIPLSIATILGSVPTQINYFVMASSVDTISIGNFRIALNFHILTQFFVWPIFTVLFPAFSKLNPSRDKKLLKTVFESSVKYSSLFLVPVIMAITILSAPLIGTIFGDKWLMSPLFLSLYVLGGLPVLLGRMSFNRLLFATGETKMLMKLNALKLCLGITFALLLIPTLGIIGLIITIYIIGVVPAIIGVYWTWKRYETKADLRNSGRIFLASTIAAITTFLLLNTFTATKWIMLAVGAIFFLLVYIICVPLVGAINQMDIKNLRIMFSGLGIISKLLEILLILIEKTLRITAKSYETRE